MFLKVDTKNIVDYIPEIKLEELELEYGLSRWFWTNEEWCMIRNKIAEANISRIREEESAKLSLNYYVIDYV